MEPQHDLIVRARTGDLDAYGDLVRATQTMAYGAARGVLRDAALAEEAAQEAYLRAFRRLADLDEPAAFPGRLRRIVISVALNMRRARRVTLLRLDDVADVPVLDEAELDWTKLQRRQLARALLTQTSEERRICDRHYHGRWPRHASRGTPASTNRRSASATASSGWRCCGTGSTTSARSRAPGVA